MKMKILKSLIIVGLFTLASAGCSKHSSSGAAAAPTDLGVVEVSNGIQTQRDLGSGRACIITPKIQTDGSIMLEMKIEESGKTIAWPRTLATSGKPVSISVGDIHFSLTPKIK